MTVGLPDPDYAAVKLLGELGRLEDEWTPFSKVEALWHGCPGHEWERLDWNRREQRPAFPADPAAEVERITRCARCGAPRCDICTTSGAWAWADLDDHARQLYRCTLERHHDCDHDYLVGDATV